MATTIARPATRTKPRKKASGDVVDVLVVGAGVSGVGAAWHLTHQRPGTRFLVVEEKDTFGGTWVTHKYPGIRSDSDLYTFGYRFKPWEGPPIATAEEILTYMREVIAESGLDQHIRYRRKVRHAAWSSETKRWTVDIENLDTGEMSRIEAGFLWMCQGYYRHDKGYTPDWPGMADYTGRIVHPQTWPDDLDLAGKQVLVIGSGATAATVVPNIADTCAHVTMLQRSPTYFIPARNANDLADQLRLLQVDPAWIHEITRKRILYDQQDFTRRCREEPEAVTAELLAMVEMFLGKDYDIKTHFTPHYRPWRQRIAFIPDGDLFMGIAQGKATVVTDEIDRFTASGVRLKSGHELKADVIVTATGFDLSVMGGIPFEVDGEAVDWAKTVTYRGMMFTGVPNLAWVFGYFRASWTLRVDMMGDFICRLLDHMAATGKAEVRVALRREDHNMPIGPWIDEEDFNPGYLLRLGHLLPRAGNKPEWRHTQDYWTEKDTFPKIDLAGEEFVYR